MTLISDLKIFTKETHKSAFKNFVRRGVRALFPNELWSADLVDMSNVKNTNAKTTFLLNIVDVYSRYAWSIPLKSKSAISVLNAFKSIGKTPKLLWVDEGKEFYNSQMKEFCEENNINMYSTHSHIKSAFVERFNRTEKEAFYKMFTEKQTKSYSKFLPIFIQEYNSSIHSSTKATPEDLYLNGGISHEEPLVKIVSKNKFKIGDYVRISKAKRTFEKGYTARWSAEVFKVIDVNTSSNPVMYELEDLASEKIDGRFYSQELQHTEIPHFKLIEKVIERKVENRKKMVKVSYLGLPEKFDNWIPESEYNKFKKEKDKL